MILNIQNPTSRHFRHKNLQKQREEQIINNNIPKTNRSEKFLDPTSAHPKSLINSMPFSQTLWLKKISEKSELNKHLNELKESSINRGYK